MTTVAANDLVGWASSVFQSLGFSATDATAIGRNLAYAELRGLPGHGFVRTEVYVQRTRAGGIRPAAQIEIEGDAGALVTLNANGAAGQVSGVRAATIAIERAKKYGVGLVFVRRANHFGATAFYSELIADAGLVGVVACNSDKAVCAPGGGRRVLGTNPLSVAAPMPSVARPVLDMATSEVSLGKLIIAAAADQAIPSTWAVDAMGVPTTDPKRGMEGALLPAGGPKGFGLAFAIDMLLAAGGAQTSPFVDPLYGDPSAVQDLGQLFLAISPDLAESSPEAGSFEDRIGDLIDAVHKSGPSPAGREALFPGEPELRSQILAEGRVPYPASLAAALKDIAVAHRIPLPAATTWDC